jgi:hypothetical protein
MNYIVPAHLYDSLLAISKKMDSSSRSTEFYPIEQKTQWGKLIAQLQECQLHIPNCFNCQSTDVDHIEIGETKHEVICNDCSASSGYKETPREAIRIWVRISEALNDA